MANILISGPAVEPNGMGNVDHGWCHRSRYTPTGRRTGRGRLTYNATSYYVGDFVDNHRSGSGRMVYSSGNTYEGQWLENLRHGEGLMDWIDRREQYQGTWFKGLQNGQGEHTWFMERFSGSQYVSSSFLASQANLPTSLTVVYSTVEFRGWKSPIPLLASQSSLPTSLAVVRRHGPLSIVC
jgi:hypothetical protein